jgi:hypothetical protein
VDEVMRGMSIKLMNEWIAFMKLENEEMDSETTKKSLIQEASQGEKALRAKRGKK